MAQIGFKNPIFVALDTAERAQALAWAGALSPHVGGFKIGLEFITANGPDGVKALVDLGRPVFADVKFHDIPNTVAGAVRALAAHGVAILNVHAGGGTAMLTAAVQAAREGARGVPPKVIAVTVLTSLDDADLQQMGCTRTTAEQVSALAGMAADAGCDGVVLSPQDLPRIRRERGPGFMLIAPGVRPAEAGLGDQKRVATPLAAWQAGADVLVVGRPITAAKDPVQAARAIWLEIESAERGAA